MHSYSFTCTVLEKKSHFPQFLVSSFPDYWDINQGLTISFVVLFFIWATTANWVINVDQLKIFMISLKAAPYSLNSLEPLLVNRVIEPLYIT